MYWREDSDRQPACQPPEDLFDLAFRVEGGSLAIDHAHALARALRGQLGDEACARIGVHQIRIAESGNGWNRPNEDGASMLLSRRVKLVLRIDSRDRAEVGRLSGCTLDLDGQTLKLGESSVRKLSTLDTLFAHTVACDATQAEEDFLSDCAAALHRIGIEVGKLLCGTSGLIRTDAEDIFTRSLLVAGLKPEESVALQRHGLGGERLLGCGLFIPHKGIGPVDQAR